MKSYERTEEGEVVCVSRDCAWILQDEQHLGDRILRNFARDSRSTHLPTPHFVPVPVQCYRRKVVGRSSILAVPVSVRVTGEDEVSVRLDSHGLQQVGLRRAVLPQVNERKTSIFRTAIFLPLTTGRDCTSSKASPTFFVEHCAMVELAKRGSDDALAVKISFVGIATVASKKITNISISRIAINERKVCLTVSTVGSKQCTC